MQGRPVVIQFMPLANKINLNYANVSQGVSFSARSFDLARPGVAPPLTISNFNDSVVLDTFEQQTEDEDTSKKYSKDAR